MPLWLTKLFLADGSGWSALIVCGSIIGSIVAASAWSYNEIRDHEILHSQLNKDVRIIKVYLKKIAEKNKIDTTGLEE